MIVLVEAQARGKSAWRLMGPAAQVRVERDTGGKITGAVAQWSSFWKPNTEMLADSTTKLRGDKARNA